jgi:pilus assembly protein CpaB
LIFVFLIIIIAGVVAFVAYNQYVKPPVAVAPSYVEVYIAGQNITQGSEIKPELLSTIKIAPENVVEVMFTRGEESSLVGKAARFQLDQGVVITSSMVGDASAAVQLPGPSWASPRIIPTGMTAMSIPTNRFALSGYAITDGALVNLNACFLFVDVDPTSQTMLPNKTATLTGTGFDEKNLPILALGVGAADNNQGRLELDPSLQQPYYVVPSEPQRPRMVCQMMLQDVTVMKLGNFSREKGATIDSPSVPPTTDANGQPVQTNPLPDIVTLIVTPQDSVTLTYLLNAQQLDPAGNKTQVRLSMTLRNSTDHGRYPTEASTLQFLLSQYNIPIPAKLPYALQPALPSLLSPLETIVTP